jgi:ribosomal-protein-alanine N-acetyltransferase
VADERSCSGEDRAPRGGVENSAERGDRHGGPSYDVLAVRANRGILRVSMGTRIPLTFRAESDRVVLRAPRVEDADELLALQSDAWDFIGPWMPAADIVDDPLAATRERAQTDRTLWVEDRSYRFVVCARKTGEIIGRVSLNNVIRGVLQSTDIGYWIGPNHARRGLTTEAVRSSIALAFGPVGLHRVQAGIIPRNVASLALARRVGFREEGLARRFVKIAGIWEDHVIFALTVEEWPK